MHEDHPYYVKSWFPLMAYVKEVFRLLQSRRPATRIPDAGIMAVARRMIRECGSRN